MPLYQRIELSAPPAPKAANEPRAGQTLADLTQTPPRNQSKSTPTTSRLLPPLCSSRPLGSSRRNAPMRKQGGARPRALAAQLNLRRRRVRRPRSHLLSPGAQADRGSPGIARNRSISRAVGRAVCLLSALSRSRNPLTGPSIRAARRAGWWTHWAGGSR